MRSVLDPLRTPALTALGLSLAAIVVSVTAALADPVTTSIVTDPFPEMKNPTPCRGDGCGPGGRPRNSVLLDCSGRRPHAARSLREAVRRAPVNGEILILGAPQGRTCTADGVVIDKPLTIRPADAIGSATIEGLVTRENGAEPDYDEFKGYVDQLGPKSTTLRDAAPNVASCKLDKQFKGLSREGETLATHPLRVGYERADAADIRREATRLLPYANALADKTAACKVDPSDANSARGVTDALAAIRTFAALLTNMRTAAEYSGGASCLEVVLPAGDKLDILGVNIVVRGGTRPCVNVLAGIVELRRSKIDSRGTRWAFDVKESGRLVLEDSVIETDGGGVRARRASVDMRRVEIKLERGRRGIGASLLGAEGAVTDLSITGGEAGLVLSSGSRDLVIERPRITDAGVGIEAIGQAGQGGITIRGADIRRSIVGAWIRQNARAELVGGSIVQSERVGVFVQDSGATLRGMTHVDGATYAVAVAATGAPPTSTAPTPPLNNLCLGRSFNAHEPGDPDSEENDGYGDGDCGYMEHLGKALDPITRQDTSAVARVDASPFGAVVIDQNTLGPAGTAVIKLAGDKRAQAISITNNILDCMGGSCISGSKRGVEERGNRCTSSGWFGSCK